MAYIYRRFRSKTTSISTVPIIAIRQTLVKNHWVGSVSLLLSESAYIALCKLRTSMNKYPHWTHTEVNS